VFYLFTIVSSIMFAQSIQKESDGKKVVIKLLY